MRTHSPPSIFYIFINSQKNIMKTTTLLLITTFFLIKHSYCQIEKGTWLVGGTGSFSSSKNSYSNPNYFQTSDVINLKISPNIGYFIIDKLAAGLRPSFTWDKAEVTTAGGLTTNIKRFEIGPFIRYYFLNKAKPFNILTDFSYLFGSLSNKPEKGIINTFSISAGPVIYFNSSIGLEFLVGYYKKSEENKGIYRSEQKGLQIAVGFQIHLEK